MEILYGSIFVVVVMGSFWLGVIMERGAIKRSPAQRERPKPRTRARPKPRLQPSPNQNWYHYAETLYKTREPGLEPGLELGLEPWVETGLGLEPDQSKSPEQRRSEFKVVGGERDG